LAPFSTLLNFEPPTFEDAARCLNYEINLFSSDDRPMSSPSLVKLGPSTRKNCPVKVPHP